MHHNFKTLTYLHSLSKHWLCICEEKDSEHLHNVCNIQIK